MPMPIIVASDVDQSGAATNEMTTVVSVLLTASPATATRIGSPAATTEPNMRSRMIAAAIRPIISEPMSPCSACCTVWPPRETSRPCWEARSATCSIRCVSSTGMSGGFTTSSRAWVRMVVPSGLTLPGVVNGSSTDTTCGTSASPASTFVTSALTVGLWAPASAWMTTSTVAPASDGKRSSSSCWAWPESEPGAE